MSVWLASKDNGGEVGLTDSTRRLWQEREMVRDEPVTSSSLLAKQAAHERSWDRRKGRKPMGEVVSFELLIAVNTRANKRWLKETELELVFENEINGEIRREVVTKQAFVDNKKHYRLKEKPKSGNDEDKDGFDPWNGAA